MSLGQTAICVWDLEEGSSHLLLQNIASVLLHSLDLVLQKLTFFPVHDVPACFVHLASKQLIS